MTPDEKFDKLIDSLDKLAAKMEGGGAPGGGPTRRMAEAGDPAMSEADRLLEIASMNEKLRLLKELEDQGFKLDEQQEHARSEGERGLVHQREMLTVQQDSLLTDDQKLKKLRGLTEGFKRQGKALAENTKEMEKGAGMAENLFGGLTKIDGPMKNILARVPKSKAAWLGMAKSMKKSVTSGQLFFDLALKLYSEMIKLGFATDKATANFRRMTGAMDSGNNVSSHYGKILSKTERQVAIFGGSHEDVGRAMGDLYSSFSDFTNLSAKQKQALTAQTVALGALGVSGRDTAQIYDQATKSLGFTDDQLIGLTETLHSTAQSTGKSTSQVAQDWATVSKELAFYGTDVVDVFQQLEKQSKATGLSVQQLMKVGGQTFDQFESGAQAVGRFNAILGGPYLNSIDMLNATEAERVEMIKASMDASGQMFSDMGKYEQKAIAAALGVDVDTARRMFGELSAAEEIQIRKQEKIAETAREAQDVMAKLKNAFYSLIVRLDPLVSLFAGFVEWLSKGLGKLGPFAKWILNITVLIGGLWGGMKMLGKSLSSPAKWMRKLGVWMRKGAESGSFMHKVGTGILKLGHGLTRMAKALLKPFSLIGKMFRFVFGIFRGGRAAMTGFMISLRAFFVGIKAGFAGSGFGIPIYLIIAAVETLIFSLDNLWAIFKNELKLIWGIVTFDGDKIMEAFNAIAENIGEIFYNLFNALTFGLLGLILKFTGGKDKLIKIFKYLSMALLMTLPGVNIIFGIVAAVWALKKVWSKWAKEIKFGLTMAFLPLILVFLNLKYTLKGLWWIVKTVFKGIVFQLKMLWKIVKIVAWGITLPFQILWKVIKTIFGGIRDVFNTTISSFKDAFKPIMDAFRGIGDSLKASWAAIKAALQPLKDAFAEIGAAFGSIFGTAGVAEGGFLDMLFGGLKTGFEFLMNVVLLPLKAFFWLLGGAIKIFAKGVQFALLPVTIALKAISFLIEGITKVITYLAEAVAKPFEFISGLFTGAAGILARKAVDIFLGDDEESGPEVTEVDDVIITSAGKIIKPNKKDSIIAAKPGGPILDKMSGMAGMAGKALGMSPLGMMGKAAGRALGGLGGGEEAAPNINVNVNVKIGEKQLNDIIIEALSSPQAGKAISPFLN